MKWIIIIVVAGFLYYLFVLVKYGNIKFWKVAKSHPEEAYSFFTENDSFLVFDSKPPDGYRANLPPGKWDGPFRLHVPSRNNFIAIYGRSPEYRIAQEDFIKTLHG